MIGFTFKGITMASIESTEINLKSIQQLTRWGGANLTSMYEEEGEGDYDDLEGYEEIDLDGKKEDEEENLFEDGMYESEEEEDEDDEEEPFADYGDDDAVSDEGDEI